MHPASLPIQPVFFLSFSTRYFPKALFHNHTSLSAHPFPYHLLNCSGERKSAVSFSVHRPHTAHHLSHKIPVSLYPRNNLLSILQNHILSLLLLLNMPCIHNNTLHHRKPMQSLPLQSHPPRKTIPDFLCGNNCERKCMTLCSSFPHRKSPDKSYILFQKPVPDHSWFPALFLSLPQSYRHPSP